MSESAAKEIEHAWAVIIRSLGYKPDDPHLEGSPERVARFMSTWHTFDKAPPKLTTFKNVDPKVDELVIVGKIQVHSLCSHHGLPFIGTVAIGYIPDDAVLGLSKFARVVDHFAHRFQVQERLTHQIADHLVNELKPKGLGVIMRAAHLCMSMRGVERPGHETITSALRGLIFEDSRARGEFMSLAGS